MNLKKTRYYIMVLLLVLLRIGQAQENALEFFLVEGPNGKALGKIRNVTQDPRGYMWFAGEDKGKESSALGCFYKYDGNKITAFGHDSANPNSLGGVGVNSVFADNAGIIWIGMSDAGLDQFNPTTGVFRHFRHDDHDPGSVSGEVTPVLKDRQGRLWVGTNNGLDQLDEKTGKFIHYRNDPKNPKSLSSNFVWNLYEDHAGTLWVATGFPWFNQNPEDGGLNRMEPDGTFTRFKHDPNDPHSLISNKVRAMFEDSRGVFWVGTSGDGLHTMDRKTGRFERHTYEPAKPDKLSRPPMNTTNDFTYFNDQVTFIQEDVMGLIWIGTMQSGLNRYDTLTKKIMHYQGGNGFPDNSGWNAYQSRDGVLWITTEEANLYRVDPFHQPINHTKTDGSFGGGNGGTSSILEDKNGFLWVGTWGHGLLKFDQQKRLVHEFENDPSDPTSLSDNGVFFISQDQEDTLWVGTSRGISILDLRTEKFSKFHPTEMFASLDTSRVAYLLNDRNGIKWISTWGNGLFKYDANNNDLKHYIPDPKDPGSIGTKDLLQIHKDNSGTLWFGSWDGGGLNRLDPGSDQFRHYLDGYFILSFYEDTELFLVGTNKGLFSYNKTNDSFSIFQGSDELVVINGIIKDDEDNLWIATNSRIVKVNKKANELFVYGTKFGLTPNNLTPGPNMVKIKNGQILKGTFDGFHYFSPAELVFKSPPTQILISDFSVNSLTVLTAKEGPMLTSVEDVSETKLSHDENNFSFDFGSDDYRTPHGVRYYSMLENYDKTWREMVGDKSASYFYVNPGNYVFKIMIYNNDGVKAVKALAIHIDPPWWKTWWAYTVYILLAAGMLAGAWRAIIQRERLKLNLKLEQLEREKEHMELEKSKEIDRMKTTFFTNISHEFRTPLTLIKGPAQNLLTEFSNRPTVKKQIKLIQHNADLLLKLVNQLLDLAKLEAGTVEVNPIKVDLNAFLNMIIDSFASHAKEKEIDLHYELPEIRYHVSLDKDKVETIITNLLGNALKFTSSGGRVDLNAKVNLVDSFSVGQLVVTVSDTGIGIPAEDQTKIFERFYQVNEGGAHKELGSGIGLSLVKELAELLSGNVTVKSEPGKGSEFCVTLPLQIINVEDEVESPEPQETEEAFDADADEIREDGGKTKLMVVEDNAELRSFIISSLNGDYSFCEAGDGKEAIEVALQEIPELIISDVMMPEMDGIAMTAKLKKDIRTSHIPIILLTAKAADEAKITGLNTGADDYLVKPFNNDELILKVRNMIESRNRIREKVRIEFMREGPTIEAISADEKLLQKVKEAILNRLSDEQLSVDSLAEEIGLSRAHFYRKVTALTGLPVNELIRSFRLERAAQLLVQQWGSVSQVAYEVGFSNPSYFSKRFKEQYGVLPSEYPLNTF